MSDWWAGDKAVCVESFTHSPYHDYPNGLVVKGTIYLVTDVNTCFSTGNTGLKLAGYFVCMGGECQLEVFGKEVCWAARQFRKLVPRSERMVKEKTKTMWPPYDDAKQKAFLAIDDFFKQLPPKPPPFMYFNCQGQLRVRKHML